MANLRYATIADGVVTEVFGGLAPQGAVQIPDGVYVTPGYRWSGTSFSPPTQADIDAAAVSAFTNGVVDPEKLFKMVKAVALWQGQLHSLTPAQVRDQVAAIYKNL